MGLRDTLNEGPVEWFKAGRPSTSCARWRVVSQFERLAYFTYEDGQSSH